MNKIITLKGTGNVSVKPDLIIITMDLESHKYDYEETMQFAADSVNILQNAIETAGFNKKDLKTTNFDIRTHYEKYRDREDNYKSKFDGYICEQGLELEFDFNMEVMSKVLAAIEKTKIEPNLNIQFTIKNKDAVSEELLILASENARKKAEILAKASGVTLGELININYNWGELRLYSKTNYAMKNRSMSVSEFSIPEFLPKNIDVSDTVTFVWEIK